MRYIIHKNQRPAYLFLYRQLRDDILRGIYPQGGRLPSKRLLAEETGLSAVTVEHAYALLCDEGYAQARERSGYFVLFRQGDGFAAAAPQPPARPARAASGETAFPLSVLSKAMRRVLTECREEILEKSPNSGHPRLLTALGQYLARNRGIRVSPEQIVVGSGAEYLYRLTVELLGRDRIYAVESPSYEKIPQIYRAAGAVCRLLPLGRDGIDSRALAQTDAEILHTTPYRSFPSGVTASASKRHEYIRWAASGPPAHSGIRLRLRIFRGRRAHGDLVRAFGKGQRDLHQHLLQNHFPLHAHGLSGAAPRSGGALSGKAGVLFLQRAHL